MVIGLMFDFKHLHQLIFLKEDNSLKLFQVISD